MTDLVCSK